MSADPESAISTTNRIRVETALSRYPIHSLTRGQASVEVKIDDLPDGSEGRWEVSYSAKYGQPGPVAYKVDTLVINRLLDELPRPVPELVRIGSLSEVCRSIGTLPTGPNVASVKNALLQNASAFIHAKIRHRTKTGREKWSEIGYSRYSVIFTGEEMPDGSKADCVYISLNSHFRRLLDQVQTRPLDYDYLRELAPGPQRFYELLSFQIFGAIASGRPRAKMRYSDYCRFAPQVRYADFDHAKKQMYKLHVTHRQSGYITDVEYQETTDAKGERDWEMLYTPGPRAVAEYRAFSERNPGARRPLALPEPDELPESADSTAAVAESPSITEMTKRGISAKKARALLAGIQPEQEILDQLEYVDSLIAADRGRKIRNPPGLYVHYIADNIAPPSDFCSSRKRQAAEQAENVAALRHVRLHRAYDQYVRTSDSEPLLSFRQFCASDRGAAALKDAETLDAALDAA